MSTLYKQIVEVRGGKRVTNTFVFPLQSPLSRPSATGYIQHYYDGIESLI